MIEIRRTLTQVEDIHHEFGPAAARPAAPLRRGAIAAVLRNPYAGPLRARYPAADGSTEPCRPADGPPAAGGAGRAGGADHRLRQGRDHRRRRRTGTRRAVACARRLCDARIAGMEGRPCGLCARRIRRRPDRQRAGHRTVHEEGRPARGHARCAADEHQRQLCAQPFRRLRDARARRAAGRRDGADARDEHRPARACRVGGLKAADIAKWDGQR